MSLNFPKTRFYFEKQKLLKYFKYFLIKYLTFFCNLESTCCNSAPKQPKPPKQKKVKKEKPKKGDAAEKADGKDGKAEAKGSGKDKEKTGKPSPYQVHIILYPFQIL